MANKKVVLAGAGGFLGRNLAPKLLEKNVSLVAITSRDHNVLEGLCETRLPENLVKIVDPADFRALEEAIQDADILLNCAFPRNKDGEQLAQGLEFTRKLFELAATCGVKSVVNVSSQSVYDPCRSSAADESSPVCLSSKYAVAKYATELMLKTACSGIPYANIRLASLIGPCFDQRVVNKFVDAALTNGLLEIVDGRSEYGYLDVRDAAEALVVLTLSDPSSWRECYNLGPRCSWTLAEMANIVAGVAGNRLDKPVCIVVSGVERYRTSSALNSEHFCRQFDWVSRIDFDQSVEDIFESKESGRLKH